MKRYSRRHFVAAAAAVGIAGSVLWWRRAADNPADHATHRPSDADFPYPLRLPGGEGWGGVLDVPPQFTIVGKPLRHAIVAGKPAPLLGFEVEYGGKTFINPLLRARSGTALRIKFWNALEEPSIVHWHGFKVDGNNDGHPHYAVPGGATYDYQFTVANRAGTYWYHPHPHGRAGEQIYRGMAGLFIVDDDDDAALRERLDLTLGTTDIPLVLQDRRLDESGTPVYAPNEQEGLHGYLGDQSW